MHQSQDTLSVRISRIQRAIENLHFRLGTLTPSQNAETLYAKTNLYVLKRSLRALNLERAQRGRPRGEPHPEPTLQWLNHSDEDFRPSL
jgi:hypothetical protein